jgi:hypothetical protein
MRGTKETIYITFIRFHSILSPPPIRRFISKTKIEVVTTDPVMMKPPIFAVYTSISL